MCSTSERHSPNRAKFGCLCAEPQRDFCRLKRRGCSLGLSKRIRADPQSFFFDVKPGDNKLSPISRILFWRIGASRDCSRVAYRQFLALCALPHRRRDALVSQTSSTVKSSHRGGTFMAEKSGKFTLEIPLDASGIKDFKPDRPVKVVAYNQQRRSRELSCGQVGCKRTRPRYACVRGEPRRRPGSSRS